MKKKLVAMLFISVFILVGCQSTSGISPNGKAVVTSNDKRDNTQYHFQPLKPGTVPQLNQSQKSQIDDKLNSVISNINSSLNSLDEVKDIDLNSVD
jgi:PBP1b-binding outer membrane lipoprotein LpoB